MAGSGEAADQVVRMSMEAGEVALKITGQGAKQLAVLLYAIAKEQKKTRGRVRMESLIRSGKPLTVFSIKERDLKAFVEGAKQYGVLYCAIRNPRGHADGMVDVMVKEEDAVRINRIVERFQFADLRQTASLQAEIEQARAGRSTGPEERMEQTAADTEQLLDDLLEPQPRQEGAPPDLPFPAETEHSRPSEPTFEKPNRSGGTISEQPESRPSVRRELTRLQAKQKQAEQARNPAERSPAGGRSGGSGAVPAAKTGRHKQGTGKER